MPIRNKLRSKAAFSMLELILVIVILGFIAALGLPRLENDPLREAADQLVRHIRYTQQLAMNDNKSDASQSVWYASNWQIWFRIFNGKYYYEIFSDVNQETNSNSSEEAKDPLTGKNLGNGDNGVGLPDNNDVNLTGKYNITQMTFSANCKYGQGGKLAFDALGRPYGDVSYSATQPFYKFLTTQCLITLQHGSGRSADITVIPETGYSFISRIDP